MDITPLIHIVASNPDPEQIDKLAVWYNDVHVPMLIKYGVKMAMRFRILTENPGYPIFLNMYHYENQKTYGIRLSAQANAEISNDSRTTWSNGYNIKWRAVYLEHQRWINPSAASLDRGAVIHIVGVNGPSVEKHPEFNQWYDQTHVPWLMRCGTIAESRRYKILEPSKEYPAYLAVYFFENKRGYDTFIDHPERIAAVKELNEHWPNGIGSMWRVQYQLLKKWEKK